MIRYIVLLSLFLLLSFVSQANTDSNVSQNLKGDFYFFWGWNRGWYSNSDIHFTGSNYDFTLYDVKAKDRQTPFAFDPYFHPLKITLPQTNMRLGYYISNKLQISLGVDHMKYVMQQDQMVKINGEIAVNSKYDGVYNNGGIILTDDFLTFEHTDGLNYINTEARLETQLFHVSIKSYPIQCSLQYGYGMGILFPKTNTKLLDYPRYDEFHVAGWGTSLVSALNLRFGKHFFIQSDFKGGFISMQDIRTTRNKADRAAQKFYFLQSNLLIGWRFRLFQ